MNAEELKTSLRKIRGDMDSGHAIRLHRAISWLRCGEQYADTDEDLSFISLWIAFNSCYSADNREFQHSFRSEFEQFAKKLVKQDSGEQIYECLWMNFSSFIRLLIENKWVFSPFWDSQRNGDDQWKSRFENSRRRAYHALANNEVAVLLSIVMDRLYVLRNQLVHGGATWQSNLNRDQVRDGKRILLELVPLFIEIMFHEDEDWGNIHFPVVDS